MLDFWTQEIFRLHPGFVGNEFMGKLALLATLSGDIALDRDQWRRRSARDNPRALNDRVNEHAHATLPGAVGILGVLAGDEQGG